MSKKVDITPCLKWAGGKRQLLPEITKRLPSDFNRYYEPFAGGSALFLNLQPTKATISDVNLQLLNVYDQLRISSDTVINELNSLLVKDGTVTREIYNAVRKEYNEKILNGDSDAKSAAMTIWLNKHCFNGLYRVNSKGEFNVPFNSNSKEMTIDTANLKNIGKVFKRKGIKLVCNDFSIVCLNAKANDFIYFDPPYVPMSETANFTSYAKEGFAYNDHRRLADLCRWLDLRGVQWMVSNNDTPVVRQLYDGYRIEPICVNRSMNSKGDRRKSTEVLITNY